MKGRYGKEVYLEVDIMGTIIYKHTEIKMDTLYKEKKLNSI